MASPNNNVRDAITLFNIRHLELGNSCLRSNVFGYIVSEQAEVVLSYLGYRQDPKLPERIEAVGASDAVHEKSLGGEHLLGFVGTNYVSLGPRRGSVRPQN